MMESIRHVALGCCVISTVAGMIRIFWPENSLAPVINAVLALYIITAALQLVRGADWQSLAAELYALTAAETEMSDSYEEYGEQLGQEASAQAIRTVLGQAGVDAAVQIRGNTCEVTLLHAEDRGRAEAVLQSSCGTLSYTITAGGDAS